jgi:hypothetical protein
VVEGRTPLNRLVSRRRLGVGRRDLPGLVLGGFSPLPHAEHENTEADTHVESPDDVLSDAGSTPAASTNPSLCSVWCRRRSSARKSRLRARLSGHNSRRLHSFSTIPFKCLHQSGRAQRIDEDVSGDDGPRPGATCASQSIHASRIGALIAAPQRQNPKGTSNLRCWTAKSRCLDPFATTSPTSS